MNVTSEYDSRSLQHEQRMLGLYRRQSTGDGRLLQPLANACWRTAAFDWRLHEDIEALRQLWEEAAKSLAEGFVRKRAGFERSPEELMLALHFSIAVRAFDVVKSLMHMVPATPAKARTHQHARSRGLLLDGYLALVRAVAERKNDHARQAEVLLNEARADVDYDWWRQQFPSTSEVDWKIEEHEAIRSLLSVIARLVVRRTSPWEDNLGNDADEDFAALMDGVLLGLDRFIESETNHRPKLYFWLPGIAVCVLAERAGMPLEWLDTRHQANQKGYDRLPLKLIHQ